MVGQYPQLYYGRCQPVLKVVSISMPRMNADINRPGFVHTLFLNGFKIIPKPETDIDIGQELREE